MKEGGRGNRGLLHSALMTIDLLRDAIRVLVAKQTHLDSAEYREELARIFDEAAKSR